MSDDFFNVDFGLDEVKVTTPNDPAIEPDRSSWLVPDTWSIGADPGFKGSPFESTYQPINWEQRGSIFLDGVQGLMDLGMTDEVEWNFDEGIFAEDERAAHGMEKMLERSLQLESGIGDPRPFGEREIGPDTGPEVELFKESVWMTTDYAYTQSAMLEKLGMPPEMIEATLLSAGKMPEKAGLKLMVETSKALHLQTMTMDRHEKEIEAKMAAKGTLNPKTWGAAEWIGAASIMMTWMLAERSRKEDDRRWQATHDLALRKQSVYEAIHLPRSGGSGGSGGSSRRYSAPNLRAYARRYQEQKSGGGGGGGAPVIGKTSIYS